MRGTILYTDAISNITKKGKIGLKRKKNEINHICEDLIHIKRKLLSLSSDVYNNLLANNAITFSFCKPNLYFGCKSILIMYIGI